MFCLYWGFKISPATEQIMCYYAQFLSRSFQTVSAIRNYISGVKKLHLFLGTSFPTADFILPLTLRGLERLNPHCPHQAFPITPEILCKIVRLLDLSLPVDAVLWSLFLTAFFTLARKSNLVSTDSRSNQRQLLRGDIFPLNGTLVVQFRWTKTIQCGQRVLRVPLVVIPGSVLCPVGAYYNMIKLVPASIDSPAFVFPSRKGPQPVTYNYFMLALRQLLRAVGLDPSTYSTHSFRRGGATYAFQANVPGELIQAQGDWLSQAYLKYLDLSWEKRTIVVQSMRDRILTGGFGRGNLSRAPLF